MHLLWLYALLIICLMAKKTCDGCGKPSNNLKNHEYTCKALLDFIDGGYKKRAEEDAQLERVKESKRKREEDERAAAREEKKRKVAERQVRVWLLSTPDSVLTRNATGRACTIPWPGAGYIN